MLPSFLVWNKNGTASDEAEFNYVLTGDYSIIIHDYVLDNCIFYTHTYTDEHIQYMFICKKELVSKAFK